MILQLKIKEKLLPCPFCGRKVLNKYIASSNDDVVIECAKCGYTCRGETQSNAVDHWHRFFRKLQK